LLSQKEGGALPVYKHFGRGGFLPTWVGAAGLFENSVHPEERESPHQVTIPV
jgi:hypothetical protein